MILIRCMAGFVAKPLAGVEIKDGSDKESSLRQW